MAKAPTKDSILRTYREFVERAGGSVGGELAFVRATGLTRFNWQGRYWASWSALQAEAGYTPNLPTAKIEDDTVLWSFASLAIELGKIPTEADLQLKRRSDPLFPNRLTFRRWGGRDALLAKLAEFCTDKPEFAAVTGWIAGAGSQVLTRRIESQATTGFVYLLRSGRKYKIGKSNAVGRRVRELAIQLPERPNVVHVIETDDADGIERYWHGRFADRREGGEWFALSAQDIEAFRRRRYQ